MVCLLLGRLIFSRTCMREVSWCIPPPVDRREVKDAKNRNTPWYSCLAVRPSSHFMDLQRKDLIDQVRQGTLCQ